MHPINSKQNFGATGIQVHYNNGTSVVTGWIVKQLGTRKFIVTSNGTNTFTCLLSTTIALNASLTTTTLPAGYMTIVVTTSAGTEYIKSIYDTKVVTTTPNSYGWSLDAAAFDGGILLPYAPAPVTNLVLTSPTTGHIVATFTSTYNDFLVQYYDVTTSGTIQTVAGPPTSSPVTITGLTTGHVYSVSVSTMGPQGTSPALTSTITCT